jgi:hypothetical protein
MSPTPAATKLDDKGDTDQLQPVYACIAAIEVRVHEFKAFLQNQGCQAENRDELKFHQARSVNWI